MEPADRPGRFGYFAAAAFAIAGVAAMVLLVLNLLSKMDAGEQFVVPGSHSFVVQEPGKHLVWNDFRTIFQGRTYDVPERLPDGLRIRVTEAVSGHSVEVSSSRGASSNTAEAERVSIASFDAPAPGRYEIVVDGTFDPRVFSVGPNILSQLFMTILAAVMAILTGLTAAVALAVWTYLRRNPVLPVLRSPATTAAAPAPPPAKAASEESARQLAMAVYALQAVSFLVLFSLIAGVIVNYVKREDVAGTWLESHFTWQIRTFWWWLAWLLVGLALAIVVVGFFVWFADAIWLVYRILKGWIRLSEGKPMYQKQ
jgi:uncharacterized membrane protein